MTIHTTAQQPWDDDHLQAETLAAMRAQPRYPLLDALASADLPTTPAVYALFLAVGEDRRIAPPADEPRLQLAVFGVLATAVFPVYIGAAISLRDRLLRHSTTLQRAVGLGPEDFWVAFVTGSHPAALFMEASLLQLKPILCDPQLSGLGSRQPGRGRPGRPRRVSGWDALVPTGRWGRQPTMAEHTRALVDVAIRVSEPDAFQPRWTPIDPGRAA